MAKKKTPQPSISQDENTQMHLVLEQYHQIVSQLQKSKSKLQVEAALTEINNLPAGAQIALLKELAKENNTDAADVLAALYEFGAQKDARKEARRSLIRLEGAKIYPRWEAPVTNQFLQLAPLVPPRFLQGKVTDSRESGEVQLVLAWETGEDYREIRVLVFLLEFWHDGVKDFFTLLESKSSFTRLLAEMASSLSDVALKDCSLTQGVRLIEEAKAVNVKYGTKPHKDYVKYRSLINQFLPESLALQVRHEMKVSAQEEKIDLSGVDPQDIVVNFVESWVAGKLSIAYQLLSQDSPLREGMTKEDWIDRRDEWGEKFDPRNLKPDFIYTREPKKSKIWLPASMSKKTVETTKEVEAGWSVEFDLDETPLEADKLPELPTPVTIYKGTSRHWFWTSFTLVQEDGAWHIQDLTDEGAKQQQLSVAEIEKHIEELVKEAEKVAQSQNDATLSKLSEAAQEQLVTSAVIQSEQALYYVDLLTKLAPLERTFYKKAASLAFMLEHFERALVYLQAMVERFPEEHALLYRSIANLQQQLGTRGTTDVDAEHAEFYLDEAEKSFFAALELEENPDVHISLAEILLEKDERLDEAKTHLLVAQTQVSQPEEEAHIELHLGEIAVAQEQFEQAEKHFQRVVALQPANGENWVTLGEVQDDLGNFAEAEISYKHAIELDPQNPEYYNALALFYRDRNQAEQSIQTLKDGLAANPESIDLHLFLVAAYESMGEFQKAQEVLEKIGQLDPDSEVVAAYREILAFDERVSLPVVSEAPKKPERRGITINPPLKLSGPKKKKKH